MVVKKIKAIDQDVYYDKLANGLDVYLIPVANRKNYYVNLVTYYGSNDLEYKSINKDEFVKSPLGTAHFLEHKVFEMADSSAPFKFFSESGTDVNAGTSYHTTKYYMWGTKDLEKNLNYFLEMVFNPHFTEKNISKERGIISEEIQMYDDDPAWQLEDCARNNLFYNMHVKDKIAGTVDSIMEINEENLYDAYNTFYQPDNMALVIGGSFNCEEIIKVVKNHHTLSMRCENKPIVRREIEEPMEVPCKYQVLKGNIVIPKMKYSFKIKKDLFTLPNDIEINLYLNCIFSTLFGTSSIFNEKVYRDKLTTGYYYEYLYHKEYYILSIEAETEKPELFRDLVLETLNNIEVTEQDLMRHKKMWLASEIRLSDRVDALVNSFIEDLVIYQKPYYNRLEIIKKLSYDNLSLIVKELNFENNSMVLMVPKNKHIN